MVKSFGSFGWPEFDVVVIATDRSNAIELIRCVVRIIARYVPGVFQKCDLVVGR